MTWIGGKGSISLPRFTEMSDLLLCPTRAFFSSLNSLVTPHTTKVKMSGQQQQIEFSEEEELQKFQRFFNLEEELYAKDEIEDAFDLYDETFKTLSEAKVYNQWRRAKKAKEWKDTDAGIRAPSTDQPTVPDPHPLDVYRDQLAKVKFADIEGVAVYVFFFVYFISR